MCYFIRIYQNRLHHNQSSENVGIMTHTNLLVELEGQHFAGPRRPLVCSQKSIDGVLARKLAESDVSISHHIIKRIKDVAMTSIPKAMPKDSESRKVPISKDSVRLGSQDTTPQNKNLSTHATSWDSYGWFDLTCDYNLPINPCFSSCNISVDFILSDGLQWPHGQYILAPRNPKQVAFPPRPGLQVQDCKMGRYLRFWFNTKPLHKGWGFFGVFDSYALTGTGHLYFVHTSLFLLAGGCPLVKSIQPPTNYLLPG